MTFAAIPFYQISPTEEGLTFYLGNATFDLPTFGIPIDPWATLVAVGCLVGMEIARARAVKMGIAPKDIIDGILVVLGLGFFMAHVVSVIAYRPDLLETKGIMAIFGLEGGFSSTGGFIGALAGLTVFYKWIRPMELGRMADLIAYAFPFGWFFGRMGCAVVHDHVGQVTESPIGVFFPSGHPYAGVHYELGLLEMVLMIPVMVLYWRLGRQDRPGWFFMGLFFTLYAPIRFAMDYLRTDPTYGQLTPAQWGMVGLFAFGVGLLLWSRGRDFTPLKLDGSGEPAGASPGLVAGV